MRTPLIAIILGACGGGGGGPDAGPQVDGGAATFDEASAYVHVVEQSDNQGSAYSAGVVAVFRSDTVTLYEEVARAGDCRLLHGDSGGFCAEPCDGLCTGDGVCLPYPTAMSAGTLTIAGLGQAVAIQPAAGYYSWYAAGPGLQDSVPVTASAPGDVLPAFSLTTPSPAPLVVTNLDQLTPAGDRPLVVEWEAGEDPDARIFLNLLTDLGHAQVHPVVIQCDAADTGALAVPQTMMAEYADPANWSCGDCFSSWMQRYTRATTRAGDVTVELRTASQVAIYLPVY